MQFFILFWGGGQSILMNTGGRDVDELHSCEKGTLLFQFFLYFFGGGYIFLGQFCVYVGGIIDLNIRL